MIKVVIIGCGYAGAVAAWKLSSVGRKISITVIDKGEYFNFLPLLPDAIGRNLPADCMRYPIYKLGKAYGFDFVHDEVTALDLSVRTISTVQKNFAYDYAIVACGSETNFYGNEEFKKRAFKLDSAADALSLTRALRENTYENYVIAGGGYTGIEIATNLRVFLNRVKRRAGIYVVERAPGILGPLPDWEKAYVSRNLAELQITVLTNSLIEKVESKAIRLAGGRAIQNAMLIWAAGVKTPDFLQKLSVEKNPQGRVKVDAYLRLNDRCFVAGDASFFEQGQGSLRMAVQFAIAQGGLAARNVIRSLEEKKLLPYKPLDLGYIIPMANNRACGVVLGEKVQGKFSVVLHYMLSIFRTYGIKNKWGIAKALICCSTSEVNMADLAILVLRLGLGFMFMAHGMQKCFGLFGGPGIGGFSQMLGSMGFVPATFWAILAAYSELLGGVCVALGVYTRIASTFLFIVMLVAIVKVHLAKGFFGMGGGFEYPFMIAVICVALMISGAGKYSILKK